MKPHIAILALIASACTCRTAYNATAYTIINEEQHQNTDRPVIASKFVQKIRSYDYQTWENDIQKIRNTYLSVVKNLHDKEAIQFSGAFLKALSLSEEFDKQVFGLSKRKLSLPNMDTLKFFYTAEKKLDEMISLLSPFTNSSSSATKLCATEAVKYFQYQKEFFVTVRDVDYSTIPESAIQEAIQEQEQDIPTLIPAEVLKANAKLLEQRDEMVNRVVLFYDSFASENKS
ncbi:MAG: hypothetical protein KGR16_02065 [Verrucomicrobia bacterium]|nr:hypothetical protein [Verrucomicrobiota bacterium]